MEEASVNLDLAYLEDNLPNNPPKEKAQKLTTRLNQPKRSTFFFKSETRVKSPVRRFDSQNLNSAINKLIYGCKAQKLFKGSFYHSTVFYINEDNERCLHWISQKKALTRSKIDLLKIKFVHDTIKEYNHYKQNEILHIIYANEKDKKMKLTIKFRSPLAKQLFWQGLLHFMSQTHSSQFRPHYELLASEMFEKGQERKTMDLKSLRTFLTNRQIYVELPQLSSLVSRINQGITDGFFLTKSLLAQVLRELLSDTAIIEIFANYCQSWLEDRSEKTDHFMELEELRRFFIFEQGQVLDDEALREMIQTYEDAHFVNKPVKDSISLSGFRNILFSRNNSFLKVNKLRIYQDMKRPLTDYYIKSSHNTYLSSNQIIGNSSVEAYIHALAHGYRCIELDCWDGDQGEPIIYHGYTLTSKISFRQVMRAIFEFGFIKNQFPIILSIENHCGKTQQKIMAEIIREICPKTIFFRPEDHDEYDFFPSPEQLKGKIIIKTKIPLLKHSKVSDFSERSSSYHDLHFGKIARIDAHNQIHLDSPKTKSSQMTMKNTNSLTKSPIESRNLNQNFLSATLSPEYDETTIETAIDNCQEYTEQKNKNINQASEIGLLGQEFGFIVVKSVWQLKFSNLKKTMNKDQISIIKELKEDFSGSREEESNYLASSQGNEKEHKIQASFHSENIISTLKSQSHKTDQTLNKSISKSINKSSKGKTLNKSLDINIDFAQNKSLYSKFNFSSIACNVDFNKIHCFFYNLIGLLGVKLNLEEAHRSVFTISSLNEAKIAKLLNEKERKIVDFHRKYLSRAYPSGKRIDSSNYDPVSAFLTGCQMVALNIQTNDLSLLLYEAMFLENGGINSGYVLKPKFLRGDSKIIPSQLIFAKKKLMINFLSIQGVSSIVKSYNSGYFLEVFLRGAKQDEDENKLFRSETIKKKGGGKFGLLVEFKVKCPDICFIVIQVMGKNEVISDERIGWCAAMLKGIRKGVRKIPLLDNQMNEIQNCFLFAKIEITKQ